MYAITSPRHAYRDDNAVPVARARFREVYDYDGGGENLTGKKPCGRVARNKDRAIGRVLGIASRLYSAVICAPCP